MAFPAKAKITALVCRGRNLPYESSGIKPKKLGRKSLRAIIRPTRNPMTPKVRAAIPKLRTNLIVVMKSIHRHGYFPRLVIVLFLCEEISLSKSMRIPGVSVSSNCPDFTAQKKAPRKKMATIRLNRTKKMITPIFSISFGWL